MENRAFETYLAPPPYFVFFAEDDDSGGGGAYDCKHHFNRLEQAICFTVEQLMAAGPDAWGHVTGIDTATGHLCLLWESEGMMDFDESTGLWQRLDEPRDEHDGR